ncbi:MAG: hypothetical protein ACE5E6_06665 [Phycisphaerae bacterium]
MRRTVFVIIACSTIVCGTAATGCAVSGPRYRAPAPPSPHLIFNPRGRTYGAAYIGRSTWPSTPAYVSDGEIIEYTEVRIDTQDRGFGRNGDRYYRRFTTIRHGRATR